MLQHKFVVSVYEYFRLIGLDDIYPVLCVPDQSAVKEISGNFLVLIQPQDHEGLKPSVQTEIKQFRC